MCRFIDEQEAGRDRSVSPNYHSLIYGDKINKSEGRSYIISHYQLDAVLAEKARLSAI